MYKNIFHIFIWLNLGFLINLPPAKAQEITQVGTSDRLSQTRPDRNEPTKVAVGLYLIDFDKFEAIDENFQLDGYLFFTWKDKRLAFNQTQVGVNTKQYKLNDIWFPDIRFMNVELARETAYTELKVTPDGTVHYKERFHGQFNSETNLKKFPFDSQTLKLILCSPVEDLESLKLFVNKNKNGKSKEAFLSGWIINDARAFVITKKEEFENVERSTFIYEIDLSRTPEAYIWNVFAPLFLIIIISWTVFWSNSFEANCGIAISCLLSAIAFNIVVAAELPKVAYLTFMNGFILISYIFIGLTLVHIVFKHRLDLEKKNELSIMVDRTARWLFPTTFGVANLILIAIFLL